MEKVRYEYLAKQIFTSCLEVHRAFGPGLLESVYEYALIKELKNRDVFVQYQIKLPLFYKGEETGKDFYLDLLIEKEIIIEVKAVDMLHPVHHAQLLSYLKLADKRLGFLVNFNVSLLKNGFKRMVNKY
ncbi:MAG: GxxExxY protein [Niabella sp.]|nr:GxxExxY protein [Niabella sp.]